MFQFKLSEQHRKVLSIQHRQLSTQRLPGALINVACPLFQVKSVTSIVFSRCARHVHSFLDVAPSVSEALANKKPVVALESTIITHGMPYPVNQKTALEVEEIVKKQVRNSRIYPASGHEAVKAPQKRPQIRSCVISGS